MKKYDIAAYIWPAYTGDEPRTLMFWPEGIGEWQSVKNAETNSAQYKPEWYETWKDRKPLWGYVNEADPDVMQMQIECAAKHGVNVFIYDWYWYDDRPFLENCLNDGYLKAPNNDKVKFYLMWANHNVPHVWDISLSDRIPLEEIWNGAVTPDAFYRLVDRWIEKYFKHPSYYKIDGKPVFMVYTLDNLVKTFGTVEKTREGIDYFRSKVKEAGFPDLHLQLVSWSAAARNHSGFDGFHGDDFKLYASLGFDSASNYQWHSFQDPGDYAEMIKGAKEEYDRMDQLDGVCYFPHVSVGWDNNPRFHKYREDVATGNTPEMVEKALRQAKEYVDSHDLPAPLVTVNSWNEWTETSYLIPDKLNGYGYLEAIKRVFVDEE